MFEQVWSELKVKTTLINEMLGTASSDPEIHEKFIASKSADKEKVKEELESLSAEERIERMLTVHYKDANGNPFIWDYMVRGFLKAALFTKVEFGPIVIGKKKIKISKYNNKRVIDNQVFVTPRKIMFEIPEGAKFERVTRPIRVDTPKGERVALATSETVPAGSSLEFKILILEPELKPLIQECMEYGQLKGFGQWRNSGCGAFAWEEIK